MPSLVEDLDPNLQRVFSLLDDYCSKNSIGYSVDCDEANEQGYLISKNPKIHELIEHIKQHMGNGVVLAINPQPMSPLMAAPRPTARKDGTLLHFAVKPLQDSVIPSEDQIKSPTTKYLRSQSPHRSSFGKARSFGGITRTSYMESKKMLGSIDPFGDRLQQSLNEHVEISFAEPDVLFAHAQRPLEMPDKEESIKRAIALESQMLEQYIGLLETTEDQDLLVVLESTVERCNDNIKRLETLLGTPGDVPTQQNQVKN